MTFDPSLFMSATISEPSIRRPPIPAGQVLLGVLGEPKMRQTEGKKESNMGEVYTWLDIPVELDLTTKPDIRAHVGADKVTLTWSSRLDLTPTGFDLSPGKNTGLRQLREAVDLNKPGDAFSIPMVQGRTVLAKIKNEPYQGEVFDRIDSIVKPS